MDKGQLYILKSFETALKEIKQTEFYGWDFTQIKEFLEKCYAEFDISDKDKEECKRCISLMIKIKENGLEINKITEKVLLPLGNSFNSKQTSFFD